MNELALELERMAVQRAEIDRLLRARGIRVPSAPAGSRRTRSAAVVAVTTSRRPAAGPLDDEPRMREVAERAYQRGRLVRSFATRMEVH